MSARAIELRPHLRAAELKRRARASKRDDPKESRRWLALWHLHQGRMAQQAAAACGLSHGWVCEVARRYNAQGVVGVEDGHRRRGGGPRPSLDAAGQAALVAALQTPLPPALGAGIWSGRKVAAWIKARTGRTLRAERGCVILRELGFGLRVPRPIHARTASPAERAAWKKSCAPS